MLLIRLDKSEAHEDSEFMCCNDLINSPESLTADDMPLSFLTSFHQLDGLHSLRWLTFASKYRALQILRSRFTRFLKKRNIGWLFSASAICRRLIRSFKAGLTQGGSVEWMDLDCTGSILSRPH